MRTEVRESTAVAKKGDRKMDHAQLAEAIIADCEGDPRAAVLAMVKINSALMVELEALTGMRAHEHAEGGLH